MFFMRIFTPIFILLCCCFNALYALEPNTAYNGTTFIYHTDKPLSLSYNKKMLHFMSHPTQKDVFIAFIPIGYYDKKIKTLKNGSKTALEITILQKTYKKEQIVVSQDKITYPDNIAKRIEKERNDMLKVYRTITKGRLWNKPFIKPLDSVITSPYGTARVFNGTLKSYHGGTDFRATIGTSVKASNDGKVALVQERYLSGKTIVIDHGEGLYSVYFHLNDFEVQQGDTIKRGQIIAKSGDTGRVSGAHLHFGIIINGTNVDAMDFIEQVNTLFDT